ncbi:alpha/beta fold hydrolase [Paenibacillus sp. HW567]|uniref:alpha/beta fold hydrolase n=1 Tax=Paenibacillus sp. HW567 TaxID=1034769 RepID=UPI0012EBD31C|nr:alpha/beta fold hydrolase [Paenibacillus sp. HW567]
MNWTQQMVTTARGSFELYVKGKGEPLCISHMYAEFSDSGNNFAEVFVKHRQVFLVNLKNSGNSSRVKHLRELSMNETVEDLESIREVLGFERWGYAGHSTGGFLGLNYAVRNPKSLELLILSGTAASNDFLKSDKCLYNFKGMYGKDYFKIFITLALPLFRKKKLAANRKWIELSLYHPERFEAYFGDHTIQKTNMKRMRHT